MLRANEASDYSQWAMANFFAGPILMVSAILLVLTISIIVLIHRNFKKLGVPEIAVRISLVLALDLLAVLGVARVVESVPLSHLTARFVALWIVVPALFAAVILRSIVVGTTAQDKCIPLISK